MSKQGFHYFASFALGWAVADTAEEAVDKLVRGFEPDVKRAIANLQREGDPGLYMWTVRVELPKDADYKINFYQPQDVPLSESQDWLIVKVTKKQVLKAKTVREMA